MKKILHLIDHLGLGGAQTVVLGIIRKDKSNYCFSLRNSVRKYNYGNIIYNKSYRKINIGCLLILKKIVKKKDFNILHCHLFKSFLIGYLYKAFINKDIKLIFHEHGKIVKNQKLYNLFINFAQDRVNKFISVSDHIKKLLIKNAKVKKNKIEVLYNFVDTDKFKKFSLKKFSLTKYNISKKDILIGFAARLNKRKGWKILLNAAKKIACDDKRFKFLIAGDGPDRNKIKNIINNYNLQNNVFLIGMIYDMPSFYNSIDCFVIPSLWEALGMTQLESLSCGTPVIASNTYGLNEIINTKNGLLFEVNNSQDLAKKIINISTNNIYRKNIIEEGYKTAIKYSLNNYLIKLKKIYNAIF